MHWIIKITPVNRWTCKRADHGRSNFFSQLNLKIFWFNGALRQTPEAWWGTNRPRLAEWALYLKKNLESPSHKDALCQVWSKLTHWFWTRRFFNFVNVFSRFCNNLLLEKGGAIWRKLNPFHRRMHCAKFGRNWFSGSGEEDFLISSMYFHHFVIISPLKKTMEP